MEPKLNFEEFTAQLDWHCTGFELDMYSRAEFCDKLDELVEKFRGLA